jgi:hypothetical protein
MLSGFCMGSESYCFCSEECLHTVVTPEEWTELYNDGNSDYYYTEWECDEEETEAIILLQEAREELEDALSFMELIEDPDTNERLIRKSELLDKLAKFIKRME